MSEIVINVTKVDEVVTINATPNVTQILVNTNSATGIQSVVAGTNITIDNTDPSNPIISAIGGGGGAVDSVNGQTGVVILDADDISDSSTSNKFVTSAEKTTIGNTSGSNTGDNATNTTSNAYADAKVADAINDGVTTIAPSQNAVHDALALKVDKTSWVNYGATSTIGGFSAITERNIWYKQFEDGTLFMVNIVGISVGSTFTFTIPITPNFSTQLPCGQGTTNGTTSNTVALAIITSGSNTIDLRATPQGSSWGVANGKAFRGQFFIKN